MGWPNNQHLVFMPGMEGTGLSAEPLMKLIPSDVAFTIVRYPTDKLLSFEETVECAAKQFPPGIPPVVVAESFSGPGSRDYCDHFIFQGRKPSNQFLGT